MTREVGAAGGAGWGVVGWGGVWWVVVGCGEVWQDVVGLGGARVLVPGSWMRVGRSHRAG